MMNKYYQNTNKSFKMKLAKDIKTFLKKKTEKDEKKLETDIKIFLKKKRKKASVSL